MAHDTPYGASRLKRGLAYFAGGKAFTALLGLANFTLIARLLSVREYAAYASIIATVELAISFSTFGVDWAGIRYLPEVRQHGNHAGLVALIRRLGLYRLASLLATALLGAASLRWFLAQVQLEAFLPVAEVYLCVMVIDGMLRFTLGVVFDSMLLQAQSQLSLSIRNATFSVILLLSPPDAGIFNVARGDFLAACGALTIALGLLVRYLRTAARSSQPGTFPPLPNAQEMRRMAFHNYLSLLLGLPYSPQSLLLLAGHYLPAETTAMLGFARNFTELIRRYQPVEMLLGLLRPILISSYAKARDFAALARTSRLLYKISLLTLCPILVACTAYGDELVDIVAKHKYPQAHWLMIGLAWTLVLRGHRVLAGTMANILDRPQLLTRTSAAMLMVVPLCALGFSLGQGPLTMFAESCVEEMLGTWIIVHGIRASGYPYQPPWPAMSRVALIAVSLSGLLVLTRLSAPSILSQLAEAAVAVAGVAILALVSGYFDAPERSILRNFTRLRAA